MFVVGDVVRITEKWLNKGEDPNRDYVVIEVLGLSRGVHDKNVKIMTKSEGRAFPDVEMVTEEMIYKVGHINLV
jgi:hypothetical protein